MASTVRRVAAAGAALGLCLGAASTIPASGNTAVPAAGGLLGVVDGGLLDGSVGGLLGGEGGLFGHEGGVVAGDDTVGDVVAGFGAEARDSPLEIVGAVSDVLAEPDIGGDGSFGSPSVGGGPLGLGGVLGGLLGGGAGLLGGVF